LVVPAALRSGSSNAQNAATPQVVIFYVGGGLHDESWYQPDRSTGVLSARPLEGALDLFDSDYQTLRDKLTVVQGAHGLWQKWPDGSDLHAHDRSTECALNCTNPDDHVDTVSLDRRFAEHLNTAQTVPFPSLQFCATRGWVYNGRGEISRHGAETLSTLFDEPRQVYERVFANLAAITEQPSSGPSTTQLLERGILSGALTQCDLVLSETSKQMGAEAAQRVQNQCDALREMEKRLMNLPPAAECMAPNMPEGNLAEAANLHGALEAYRLLGTNALACGLTNVVLMEVWRDQPDEGAKFQAEEFQDLIIHLWHFHRNNGEGDQNLAYRARMDLDRRTVTEFAKWGIEMNRFQMLDSGLLLWATNEPRGDHSVNGANPCLYAGSLGGALQQGSFIKLAESVSYGNDTVVPSINEVYVALLRAAGIDTDKHGPDKYHRTGSEVFDQLLL
jgi:hypothetical protein